LTKPGWTEQSINGAAYHEIK